MRKDSLKIGVVGAGVFGNFYAGKCAAHPDVDFVGVFDPNHDKVRQSAKIHHTRAFDNFNTMMSGVDAVIVACPAIHHGPISIAALKAGRHVLAEKPIAHTVEFATQMIETAKAQNLVLQIGHQERFVANAIGLDRAPHHPLKIHATRFGTRSDRGTDVSVALDLMIHDFDMACWLMGGEPVSMTGDKMKVYSDHADAARVKMRFGNGGVVTLEASRAEAQRERVMILDYPDGQLKIDFVNKTFSDNTGYDFDPNFGENPMAQDSLGTALEAFIRSVMEGVPIAIPGEVGLRALTLAVGVENLGN